MLVTGRPRGKARTQRPHGPGLQDRDALSDSRRAEGGTSQPPLGAFSERALAHLPMAAARSPGAQVSFLAAPPGPRPRPRPVHTLSAS